MMALRRKSYMETKRAIFFFKERLNCNTYLECGKQFYRRVSFCVHVRIRIQERPYKCDIIIIIIIIIIISQETMKSRNYRKQPYWALRTYFEKY